MAAFWCRCGVMFGTLGVLVTALPLCVGQPGPPEIGDAESPTAGPSAEAAAERAIRDAAERYAGAFNAGDAVRAAEQFLPQAEYLSAEGASIEGRDAIEKDLAELFKESPHARIAVEVESIRLVGPRVAIEEGRTAVTLGPDEPPVRQRYLAVNVLMDGKWKLASVRESPDEEGTTPRERLESLAWMVGEWIDESDAGVVSTVCRWSDDGNFLLQEFELQVAGRAALSGQQRIGWDPLTQHVRSWVFDSAGGFGEGIWTWDGERWIVKASGVRADGTVTSATNFYSPLNEDSYRFESTARVVGDAVEPDVQVLVVKRAPAPARRAAENASSPGEK